MHVRIRGSAIERTRGSMVAIGSWRDSDDRDLLDYALAVSFALAACAAVLLPR